MELEPDSRGLAVIFTNNYEDTPGYTLLSGTSVDGERLKGAFKALHFDVHWICNVTAVQLEGKMYELSKLQFQQVKHYKCIVFVFSGHGERPSKLVMQDGCQIDICNQFIKPVLPGSAPNIGDIPRIFIIDACRGQNRTETVHVPNVVPTDKGNAANNSDSVSDAQEKGGHDIPLRELPKEGNFLVAYSTLPGHVANEYRDKGSLWLEILASKLSIDSQLSLDDTLTQVNKELMEKCQKERGYVFQQPEKLGRLNDILYLGRDPTTTDVAFTGMSKP